MPDKNNLKTYRMHKHDQMHFTCDKIKKIYGIQYKINMKYNI